MEFLIFALNEGTALFENLFLISFLRLVDRPVRTLKPEGNISLVKSLQTTQRLILFGSCLLNYFVCLTILSNIKIISMIYCYLINCDTNNFMREGLWLESCEGGRWLVKYVAYTLCNTNSQQVHVPFWL